MFCPACLKVAAISPCATSVIPVQEVYEGNVSGSNMVLMLDVRVGPILWAKLLVYEVALIIAFRKKDAEDKHSNYRADEVEKGVEEDPFEELDDKPSTWQPSLGGLR